MPEVLFGLPVIILMFIWHPNTKWVWPVLVNVAMKLTRRNTLIGLGAAAAGAGAIGGTGAFSSVTAERTVNVQTTGDGSAALSLEPTGSENASEYVTAPSDGTIQLDLDGTSDDSASSSGLNQNARSKIHNLVKITNNGSQEISTLTLEITDDSETDLSGVFEFTKGSNGGTNIGNNADLTGGSGLSVGSDVVFGLVVDLLDNNNNVSELPSGTNYTLTITAET